MKSPEQLPPLEELQLEQLVNFITIARALLPPMTFSVEKNDPTEVIDSNQPELSIVGSSYSTFQVADTLIDISEYDWLDTEYHVIQVTTMNKVSAAVEEHVDPTITLKKTYEVDPNKFMSSYDENRIDEKGLSLDLPIITSGELSEDELLAHVRNMGQNMFLEYKLGLNVFTQEKYSEIMALLSQCSPEQSS